MPLKIYCPSCSGMCGGRFGNSTNASVQKPVITKPVIRTPIHEEETEGDVEEQELKITLSALQLKTPLDTEKDKGIKFGEVMKQRKTGWTSEKPKKVNKKKEFEAFLESAKNTKKPIEIEDNSND